jgi:hypothetical protein
MSRATTKATTNLNFAWLLIVHTFINSTPLVLNCNIKLLVAKLIAEIILSPFNLNFWLHTYLSREPWAKLWYCLRALDREGRGYYQIPIELLEMLTGADEKTIYRWLKDGRSAGAFRRYKVRDGILRVWLGSLFAVCEKMNLANWGAVAVANLLEISKIRELTTATATQKLQQRSRYAADHNLKKKYRKLYGSPHPNELIESNQQSSLKSTPGQVPFVIYISETKLFVSKGFTAFGTSQDAISRYLGIHVRTVQRHQTSLNLEKRQLCQSKSEYAQLKRSLDNEATEAFAYTDGILNPDLGYKSINEDYLQFLDGQIKGGNGARVNEWKVPAGNLGRRFFCLGRKTKKWFMAKCNIYREDMQLKTMYASRKAFKARIKQLAQDTVTLSSENGPSRVRHVVT